MPTPKQNKSYWLSFPDEGRARLNMRIRLWFEQRALQRKLFGSTEKTWLIESATPPQKKPKKNNNKNNKENECLVFVVFIIIIIITIISNS